MEKSERDTSKTFVRQQSKANSLHQTSWHTCTSVGDTSRGRRRRRTFEREKDLASDRGTLSPRRFLRAFHNLYYTANENKCNDVKNIHHHHHPHHLHHHHSLRQAESEPIFDPFREFTLITLIAKCRENTMLTQFWVKAKEKSKRWKKLSKQVEYGKQIRFDDNWEEH